MKYENKGNYNNDRFRIRKITSNVKISHSKTNQA